MATQRGVFGFLRTADVDEVIRFVRAEEKQLADHAGLEPRLQQLTVERCSFQALLGRVPRNE